MSELEHSIDGNSFPSFKHLPPDIWRLIFWEWVTDIQDILSADTALCATQLRSTWLSLLHNNSFRKVSLSPASRSLDIDVLHWFRQRGIRAVEQVAGMDLRHLSLWRNFFNTQSGIVSRASSSVDENSTMDPSSPYRWSSLSRLRGLMLISNSEEGNLDYLEPASIAEFLGSCRCLQGFGLQFPAHGNGNNNLPFLLLESVTKHNKLISLQLNFSAHQQIPQLASLIAESSQYDCLTALTLHIHCQQSTTTNNFADMSLSSLHIVQILRALPHLRIFDCFGFLSMTDMSLGEHTLWSNTQIHPDLTQIRHLQLGMHYMTHGSVHTESSNYAHSLHCYLLYKCIHVVSVAVTSNVAFQQAKLFAMSAEEHRGLKASEYQLVKAAVPMLSTSRLRHKYLRHVLRLDIASCRYTSRTNYQNSYPANGVVPCLLERAYYPLCLEGMSFTARPDLPTSIETFSFPSMVHRTTSDADLEAIEARLLLSKNPVVDDNLGDFDHNHVNHQSLTQGIDFLIERSQALHRMLRLFGAQSQLDRVVLSIHHVAAAITWSTPASRAVSDSSPIMSLTSNNSCSQYGSLSTAVTVLSSRQTSSSYSSALAGSSDEIISLPISPLLLTSISSTASNPSAVESPALQTPVSMEPFLDGQQSQPLEEGKLSQSMLTVVAVPSATTGGYFARLLRSACEGLQSLTLDNANCDLGGIFELLQLLPVSTKFLRVTSTSLEDEHVLYWSQTQPILSRRNTSLETLHILFEAQKLSPALMQGLARGLGRICTHLKHLKVLNVPGDADDSYVESLINNIPSLVTLSLHRSGPPSGIPVSSTMYFMPRPASFMSQTASPARITANNSNNNNTSGGFPVISAKSLLISNANYAADAVQPVQSCLQELELYGIFPHNQNIGNNSNHPSSSIFLVNLLMHTCPHLQSIVWSQARLCPQQLSLWLTIGHFPVLRRLEFPQLLGFVAGNNSSRFDSIDEGKVSVPSMLSSLVIQLDNNSITANSKNQSNISTNNNDIERGNKGWSASTTSHLLTLLRDHQQLTALTLGGVALDDELFSRLLFQTKTHLLRLQISRPHERRASVPLPTAPPRAPPTDTTAKASSSKAPHGFGRIQSDNRINMQQFLQSARHPIATANTSDDVKGANVSSSMDGDASREQDKDVPLRTLTLESLTLIDALAPTSELAIDTCKEENNPPVPVLREIQLTRLPHVTWLGIKRLLVACSPSLQTLSITDCALLSGTTTGGHSRISSNSTFSARDSQEVSLQLLQEQFTQCKIVI